MSKRQLFCVIVLIGSVSFGLMPPRISYAADARCANTLIQAPAPDTMVSNVLDITGRAQLEGAFVRYQVDYSATGLNLWVLLNSAPQAVMDGTLAHWDTTTVPAGTYDLRVRSIDTSGNYCETIVSPVYVAATPTPNAAQSVVAPPPIGGTIQIPTSNGLISVAMPQVPPLAYCTPAAYLGALVTHSVRLCAGQIYRPFTVVGNNIAIVGDSSHTATIQSTGRTYGIEVRGSNVLISGVHISGATAAADTNNWLCLYAQCDYASPPVLGGQAYGGGILLAEGTGNMVVDSAVTGGVIGIAVAEGREDKLVNNQLTELSGWGIFASSPSNSAFIGNTLNDINRGCISPAGEFFGSGCESAGMLLLGADTNIIANNSCARSGNCYYLNGEGGRPNNFNKLYGNTCSAPAYNCFEITDAMGIEFDGNSAALTPEDTAGCAIWLVRAHVMAGANNQVAPCNFKGSHLDSTYEPPKHHPG